MSDVDDILGGSATPPGVKFETVGTKHIVLITQPPKSVGDKKIEIAGRK